ncbi:MAG: 2OG-Fe(II) oxygenase [Verrucomicrobiales bacterium]
MSKESDSGSIQVSYSSHFPELLETLKQVNRPGDYFSTGMEEAPMPGIRVKNGESLSFPVPAAQAKQLIAAAGEKAPYGRGADTLVDESVRKVWQVAPEHVAITGTGWSRTLEAIVRSVAQDLGCERGCVEIEFYKLLVYEKGGFFTAHRDSEKTGGMFGTLIVVLPSAHEGGQLTIRHAGRETTLHMSATAPSEVRFAAFYADCEHEVAPISKGYRICLVYNLVRTAPAKPEKGATVSTVGWSVPDQRPAVIAVANHLQNWRKQYGNGKTPQKIVYLLEHRYTAAGLSFTSLKNGDSALGSVLRDAARSAGCALHLGIVHIHESGWAEYAGDGGRWNDLEDDFVAGEVYDADETISDWVDTEDEPVSFGAMPLEANELLPPGALDDEDPDEIHFSEATGNAGVDFERTYLRAAFVLWPEENSDSICLSVGLEAGVGRLEALAYGDAEAFARFARVLCSHWKADSFAPSKVTIAEPIELITAHGDPTLLAECLRELVPCHYKGEHNPVIAEAIVHLDDDDAAKILSATMSSSAKQLSASCIDLWNQVATRTKGSRGSLSAGAATLIDVLPKANMQSGWSAVEAAKARWAKPKPEKVNALTFEVCTDFLTLLVKHCSQELCTKAVAAILSNKNVFAADTILAPSLAALVQNGNAFPQDLIAPLWQHAARVIARRSSKPPAPPRDWQQPATWQCSCGDCSSLRFFAVNPNDHILRMPLTKDRRMHIHRIIDDNGLDMTHVTERKGRPQTLVCTKTQAAYEKKRARHAADVKVMQELARIGQQLPGDENRELLTKLLMAIAKVEPGSA